MFCPSSPNWREKGSTFTPAPPPPPTFCFSSLKVPFVTFLGTSRFSPDKFQHDRQKEPFGDLACDLICLYFVYTQVIPSPFDHSHVVTTTTHKTLRAVRYWKLILLKFWSPYFSYAYNYCTR